MKTCLVVFYSRTGITREVATEIAKAGGCDLEEVHDVKTRSGWLGYACSLYEAVTAKLPKIKTTSLDPAEYQTVVLGTPVWAGNMSSPMRSYIAQNNGRFKRIATFCTMGGSGGDKALENVAALCDARPVAKLVLTDKQIENKQYLEQHVAAFVKALMPGST
jgi:flavodoxin